MIDAFMLCRHYAMPLFYAAITRLMLADTLRDAVIDDFRV